MNEAINMLNIKTGIIDISEQLKAGPDYSFEEFKKTAYYNGQDGIMIIYLEDVQIII